MSKHTRAIVAAEHAIALLERGQPVGTECLATIAAAVGWPTGFLRRRPKSGYIAVSVSQRERAIGTLRDYIEDRELEIQNRH